MSAMTNSTARIASRRSHELITIDADPIDGETEWKPSRWSFGL